VFYISFFNYLPAQHHYVFRGADPAFYLGGRKIGEGSGDHVGPQWVQGSALVGGQELLHFDVLGPNFTVQEQGSSLVVGRGGKGAPAF
jgi:hypothetical protein